MSDLTHDSLPSSFHDTPPNDPEAIALLECYIQNLAEKAQHINDAIKENDYDALFMLAQQLNDSTYGQSFEDIVEALPQLKQKIQESTYATELKKSVEQLASQCKATRKKT